MFKTIALAAALAAAPATASTLTYINVNGWGQTVIDGDASRALIFGDNLVTAEAINTGGGSVEATYAGTDIYAGVAAYASTRYQYDAVGGERVTLGTTGYVRSLGLGHAFVVMAAWQLNAVGDVLWQDIFQIESCSVGCDITGEANLSQTWTRLAHAGDSLFLTITANSYGDLRRVASRSAFPAAAGQNQAQSWVSRNVTISAVPEPATWPMLIAGFGVTGLARRRSRARLASLAG